MLAMNHPVVASELLIKALTDVELRRKFLILLASSSRSQSIFLRL